jgi:hypothetical protein
MGHRLQKEFYDIAKNLMSDPLLHKNSVALG